jgi:cysteine desulfuration protein SufE
MNEPTALPPQLASIVQDFAESEGREKLELLLEFSEQLPPLPARLREHREKMEQVHECMTPVFVHAELADDGTMAYFFDVPPESPTVRGYAALLAAGLAGLTPQQVLAVPDDFFLGMGLQKVLSGQRLNGISAMLAYLKRLAVRQLAPSP